ncbi:haloacid dehalogenase type II [Albirhodobacter sp. R86504]|uniref:haloacid dehalogenase type II n=1 Tax=Albirhodobacter sp. R86504 TaxID=3093848 RepID=UPI00366F5D9F
MAIKAIFFDVNETTLDLAPLKASIGAALGGREDLLPLWFTTLLQYSLVDTLTQTYRDFADVGVATLQMIAQKYDVALTRAQAEDAVRDPFTKMPAHPDVIPALQELRASGVRLVVLANSAADVLAAQFEFAQIAPYFERVISVEEVKAFKPDPRPYLHALKTLDLRAEEVAMVAAHAWDLAGAKKVGLRTVFVARKGQVLYPNAARPDHVIPSFAELKAALAL